MATKSLSVYFKIEKRTNIIFEIMAYLSESQRKLKIHKNLKTQVFAYEP